jgi:hypothetical protein
VVKTKKAINNVNEAMEAGLSEPSDSHRTGSTKPLMDSMAWSL